MVSKKKLLFVIVAAVLVILSIVIILFVKNGRDDSVKSDIEKSTKYKITDDGATIYAFNSVPKEIVNKLKEYIKNNGYVHPEIKFIFQNSKATFNPNFPSNTNDEPFIYYVTEIKYTAGEIDYKYNRHNIFVGDMAIDEDGNVVETHNLMTAEELSRIQTEPDISFIEPLRTAKDYLHADESTPAEIWSWCFCTPQNDDEWILCYKIKFEDNDSIIYIDGITGERIE